MKNPISITAIGTISPLGNSLDQVWKSYQSEAHFLGEFKVGEQKIWGGRLSEDLKGEVNSMAQREGKYKNLDLSVLYAIYAARKAFENAGWTSGDHFGINIGSSRGATALFEKFHQEFLQQNNTATLASPTTTLGNVSSWVAHDLGTKGPEISHSITCSTALHSLLNGIAWLQSGMAEKFLVGGSEAPLTPFTIAQMQALKIYSKAKTSNLENIQNYSSTASESYPCRALDLAKTKNTMVLGEGASVACVEKGNPSNALAKIIGIGYATEALQHNVSISADAQCFQDSMAMAVKGISPEEIDVIVMHAPGTVKGDASEMRAIEKVFCNKIPFLTTNKWKVGHTFGASGMLSVEMAILMLLHQKTISVPYIKKQDKPTTIKKIMVNAVGFGGNAVSILLTQ